MPDRTPEQTVQANVDAYNAGDIAAFAATYAPEAKFCKVDGTVLLAGREAIGAFHKKFFTGSAPAKCVIEQHVVMGPFVVDHQHITVEGRDMHVMLISEVRDGLIVRASYSPI
jgi:putative hydrolase of HD superfamily